MAGRWSATQNSVRGDGGMCPEPTKRHRQSVSCHYGALGAQRLEPGKGERGGGLLGTAKWRSRGARMHGGEGKGGPQAAAVDGGGPTLAMA
jgi:hypothetical protein